MDRYEISICEIVAGIACRRVSPHQRLYQDLGLAGDDVTELFEKVSEKFATQFDKFCFEEYFPNESEALSERLERWLGVVRERKVFTVGHLSAVAQRGEWFEPLGG